MSDIIYKYDKNNRIVKQFIEKISYLTTFDYKYNFRKRYCKCKNIESYEIVKEILLNDKYKRVSSLVSLGKLKVYTKFDDNEIEIYSKTFTKNKTIFEVKTLIRVGISSIEEMTFTKNNKKEKHIRITTKKNGRNNQQ